MTTKEKWLKAIAPVRAVVINWSRDLTGWQEINNGANGGISVHTRDTTTMVKREDPKSSKGYIKKPKTYKIWRCDAEIDAPVESVSKVLNDLASAHKWNKVVESAAVIQKLDDNTDVTWYRSAPTLRGTISSRDFVTVRRCEVLESGARLITSIGAVHPEMPVKHNVVRGWNGPGGFLLEPIAQGTRTRVIWILNVDVRIPGFLPRSVVDSTMTDVAMQMGPALRSAVFKSKNK